MMAIKRGSLWAFLALTAWTLPIAAQRGQRRAALVLDIERVFIDQAVQQMGLTDDQATRFRRVEAQWGAKRAGLETEERQLQQALGHALTPGVAGNPDSVSRFVDALNENRVQYAESFRDEMHDLSTVLTPIQRGQFQLMRDRLLARVRQLQESRPGNALRQEPMQP